MDLNVHLNVSRIENTLGNINDSISDITLITVHVVKKMNMLKIPIHAHGFTTSTYTPIECLNIDFIGPFPDQGYILVIVDTFTRWVELYHSTDATALSAAECLLKTLRSFWSTSSITIR